MDNFRQADYYSLRDKYYVNGSDIPTYTLSIEIDGHSKTVTDYSGKSAGMPKAVSELEDQIDRTADTARWTNGNGNTVPSLKEENFDFKSAEAAGTLARVVQYGNASAVRDLIAAGAPLNGVDDTNCSPLEEASHRGNVEMLRALHEAGVNP